MKTKKSLGVVALFPALSLLTGLLIFIFPPLVFAVFIIVFSFLLSNRSYEFEAPVGLLKKMLLLLIFFYLIWPRYLAFQLIGPDITPQRLLQLGISVVWLVSLISHKFRSSLFSKIVENKTFFFLVLILFIWRLASAFGSEYLMQSIYSFGNETITNFIFMMVLFTVASTVKDIESIFKVLIYSTIIIVLLASAEYFHKGVLFSAVHIPGMKMDSDYLAHVLNDKSRGGQYRAQSTFSNPLLLAQYVVFVTPIVFFMMFNKSNLIKTLCILLVPLLLITSYMTGSRAGLLVELLLIFVGIFYVIVHLTRNRKYSLIGWGLLVNIVLISLLLVWLIVDSGVLTAYLSGNNIAESQSSLARVRMIDKGIPLILIHPILGYGVSTAAGVLNFYGSNRTLTIDNFYLSLALDTGIVGLTLYILLPLYLSIKSFFPILKGKVKLPFFLLLSIWGVMVTMTIMSLDYLIPMFFLSLVFMLISLKVTDDKI